MFCLWAGQGVIEDFIYMAGLSDPEFLKVQTRLPFWEVDFGEINDKGLK